MQNISYSGESLITIYGFGVLHININEITATFVEFYYIFDVSIATKTHLYIKFN